MDTKARKKKFIEIYAKTFGNVSQTCKTVGCARSTFYGWRLDDEKFAKELDDINPEELYLDFVESKAVQQINDGNTAMIIFTLKTKGKGRGYVERTEHSIERPPQALFPYNPSDEVDMSDED